MSKAAITWIALVAFCAAPAAWAQRGNRQQAGRAAGASEETPEEGIPVTDPLVISKCGTCHAKDAKGNLARISWERATPEGWEEAIKRMVRLNGLVISPADARSVVKYLATWHGLAPEEAKPVMYIPEHRIQDETIVPNDAVRGACTNCHALGRAMSWRRSKADWQSAGKSARRAVRSGGGGVPPSRPGWRGRRRGWRRRGRARGATGGSVCRTG